MLKKQQKMRNANKDHDLGRSHDDKLDAPEAEITEFRGLLVVPFGEDISRDEQLRKVWSSRASHKQAMQ